MISLDQRLEFYIKARSYCNKKKLNGTSLHYDAIINELESIINNTVNKDNTWIEKQMTIDRNCSP